MEEQEYPTKNLYATYDQPSVEQNPPPESPPPYSATPYPNPPLGQYPSGQMSYGYDQPVDGTPYYGAPSTPQLRRQQTDLLVIISNQGPQRAVEEPEVTSYAGNVKLACCVILCCCNWPFGLFALILAVAANMTAASHPPLARRLGYISIRLSMVGIAFSIMAAFVLILVFATGYTDSSTAGHKHYTVELTFGFQQTSTTKTKIIELEEELKVVSNNMKSLEIAEQEAALRQESYEMMVQSISERLQDAELRATEAERAVTKLQKEVDRLEDELGSERDKFRLVATELDSTFTELAGF